MSRHSELQQRSDLCQKIHRDQTCVKKSTKIRLVSNNEFKRYRVKSSFFSNTNFKYFLPGALICTMSHTYRSRPVLPNACATPISADRGIGTYVCLDMPRWGVAVVQKTL